ncbi:MAG: hypothetical protein Q8K58_00890 [Acidimicrobiales bacterium]|nr:hypothetical protein [Acidimicrobiales bacterium]
MRRAVLLVLLAVVVLWPAAQRDPADGFPVSSYPMFAKRSGTVVRLATAVGIDRDGDVHRLGPHPISGSDEVVLAAELTRRAVEEGHESSAALCREVAARVDPNEDVVSIEVRTEVRDAVADVRAEEDPLEVLVHARCAVAP